MTPKELSDIRRNLKVLNYATELGNAAAACRRFGISSETLLNNLLSKEAISTQVLAPIPSGATKSSFVF